VYNAPLVARLKQINAWTAEHLPNYPQEQDTNYIPATPKQYGKRMAQWLLNRMAPGAFNRFLMRLTDRKWRAKWQRKGFPMNEYDEAFYTTLHVSKNHPANFQRRILQALETNTELL
jgi:hypothetical protein